MDKARGRKQVISNAGLRGERTAFRIEVGHPRSPVPRILSPNAVCVSFPFHVVFLQFAVQCRPMNAQCMRSASDVVVSGFKGHEQGLPFNLFE